VSLGKLQDCISVLNDPAACAEMERRSKAAELAQRSAPIDPAALVIKGKYGQAWTWRAVASGRVQEKVVGNRSAKISVVGRGQGVILTLTDNSFRNPDGSPLVYAPADGRLHYKTPQNARATAEDFLGADSGSGFLPARELLAAGGRLRTHLQEDPNMHARQRHSDLALRSLNLIALSKDRAQASRAVAATGPLVPEERVPPTLIRRALAANPNGRDVLRLEGGAAYVARAQPNGFDLQGRQRFADSLGRTRFALTVRSATRRSLGLLGTPENAPRTTAVMRNSVRNAMGLQAGEMAGAMPGIINLRPLDVSAPGGPFVDPYTRLTFPTEAALAAHMSTYGNGGSLEKAQQVRAAIESRITGGPQSGDDTLGG